VAWGGTIGADHLIGPNDEVADDPLQRALLPEAARGVRTSVLSIADTIGYCASSSATHETIMILAREPLDALRLLENGLACDEINVGNQAPTPGTAFTMVTRSVSVTADDAHTYRRIATLTGSLHSRLMPTDHADDFLGLLAKKRI
jgi:PTS system mannose-specific IIB component